MSIAETVDSLDNSISYENASLFLCWIRWSIGRSDEWCMKMFNILLSTGAKQDPDVDIFHFIMSRDLFLGGQVARCLFSQRLHFPIKWYHTGSSLACIVFAMTAWATASQLAQVPEMEDEITELILELSRSDPTLVDSGLAFTEDNEFFLRGCGHPIAPLVCAIKAHSLKLITCLTTAYPFLSIDHFFFFGKYAKQTNWQSVEDWVIMFNPPDAIRTIIDNYTRRYEKYLDDVRTTLCVAWGHDLASILYPFLARPLRALGKRRGSPRVW
jgi:hypothetical protein